MVGEFHTLEMDPNTTFMSENEVFGDGILMYINAVTFQNKQKIII